MKTWRTIIDKPLSTSQEKGHWKGHFLKNRDSFCDSLYDFLQIIPLLKRGLLQKKEFAPLGSKFFLLEKTPFHKICKRFDKLPPQKVYHFL